MQSDSHKSDISFQGLQVSVIENELCAVNSALQGHSKIFCYIFINGKHCLMYFNDINVTYICILKFMHITEM